MAQKNAPGYAGAKEPWRAFVQLQALAGG
jgi:hypothetical protein